MIFHHDVDQAAVPDGWSAGFQGWGPHRRCDAFPAPRHGRGSQELAGYAGLQRQIPVKYVEWMITTGVLSYFWGHPHILDFTSKSCET